MHSKNFKLWFIALSAILNHPLTTYAQDRIEKRITNRSVAEQLAPMLIGQAAPLRPDDLVERSWNVICPFIKLGDNEAKYIASIQLGRVTAKPDTIIKALSRAIGLKISEAPLPHIIDEALKIRWTRDVFDRLLSAEAQLPGEGFITADETIRSNLNLAVW